MEMNNFDISDTLIMILDQTARIERALAVRYFNEQKDVNLTFNEFLILNAIKKNPGIYQRDLAKLVLIGTANLSKELDKLEDKKFIERKIKPLGKKVVKTLHISKSGIKQLSEITLAMQKYIIQMESIFSEVEYAQFREYMQRLRNKFTESIDMVFE